jgi:hypothetical protein
LLLALFPLQALLLLLVELLLALLLHFLLLLLLLALLLLALLPLALLLPVLLSPMFRRRRVLLGLARFIGFRLFLLMFRFLLRPALSAGPHN